MRRLRQEDPSQHGLDHGEHRRDERPLAPRLLSACAAASGRCGRRRQEGKGRSMTRKIAIKGYRIDRHGRVVPDTKRLPINLQLKAKAGKRVRVARRTGPR